MLEQHAYDLGRKLHRYMQRGIALLVFRSHIRTMLEQHAYDLGAKSHRYMQWGIALKVLRSYIRTMLEQQAYNLGRLMSCRHKQRGPAARGPCVYVRTTLKQ